MKFWIASLFLASTLAQSESIVFLPLKALPRSLSVSRLVQADDSFVADLIAEGLFDVGEGFQINPVLAESVSWRDGGKTLNIRLRKTTFSDGSPLNAEAVITSLERCIRNAELALTFSLQHIDGYSKFLTEKNGSLAGLRKISSHEIEIKTTQPSPLLPDSLTFSNCYIVKPVGGSAYDLLNGAVATGPYAVSIKDDKEIHLVKRKGHHRQNLGPDRVVFRSTEHYGDYNNLKTWATLITTEGDVGDTPEYNKVPYSQLGSYQLVFNNSRPPFNSVSIRKAVAAAIDFDVLAKELGWPADHLQQGLFPRGMRGFKSRTGERNVAFANKLLAKAGFTQKRPLEFSIFISKSKLSNKEQGVWPRVFQGTPVRVRVELLEQEELVRRRNTGSFSALRILKMPGSVDGYRLLTSYLSNSTFNTPKSITPECDNLISAALSVADVDLRYQNYERAEECLMRNAILVPLSTVPPGFVLLKKPWRILRKSRYNLKPYLVSAWTDSDKN